ncbi:MAG: 16S rRNA (adenine(1518)-N(6)/adenine(1519)-N(6))-dimethyltransferase RsmA [Bacteroidota bacterium]
MEFVKAKKGLGQHFLTDENIALEIVNSLTIYPNTSVLEIGPGMGVLTKYLKVIPNIQLKVMDIDHESVAYLLEKYPEMADQVILADFLNFDYNKISENKISIIGNFPYNISTQILFSVYDHRNQVPEVVGMFQKEVAERIASKKGNKSYGILSVLLQAFYDIEYLFTVEANVFNPPPKVKSGVIRLKRNNVNELPCDEKLFVRVVKAIFNQRRKTIRNSLKNAGLLKLDFIHPFLEKRPEQLSVEDFIELTRLLEI